MSNAQQRTAETRKTNFRVMAGSLSGSTIEWYDFFLYATASALIFNEQFFPTDDPYISQMLAYLTLALTFFIRPLGGIVFSHFTLHDHLPPVLTILPCTIHGLPFDSASLVLLMIHT